MADEKSELERKGGRGEREEMRMFEMGEKGKREILYGGYHGHLPYQSSIPAIRVGFLDGKRWKSVLG